MTQVSDSVKARWKRVKVVIVDEYGTCGKNSFARLDEALRLARGEENLPFGGLDAVLIGDHFQLDPTKDTSLHSVTSRADHLSSRHRQADLTFSLFRTVINLTHNFRAEEDALYVQFLTRLRDTAYFDNKRSMRRDLAVLNERVMSLHPLHESESPPVILVNTNAERRAITEGIRDFLLTNQHSIIYQWMNRPALTSTTSAEAMQVVEEYSWQTGTKIKAPPSFWAYIGMPVSVTTNISPAHQSLGVATGAFGTIVDIQFRRDCMFQRKGSIVECSQIPKCIVVKLDTPAHHQFKGYNEACRPIEPIQTQGKTVFRKTKKNRQFWDLNVPYDYQAFPLKHRFASTFHSMQCLSCENVVLPIPKKIGTDYHKLLYLGLSRGKGYKSIRLIEKITVDDLVNFRPSQRDVEVEKGLLSDHEKLIRSLGVPASLQARRTNDRRT
jgi:hypothetical protein